MVSAVSLLLRHWRSIEAAALGLAATGTAKQELQDSLRQHLLDEVTHLSRLAAPLRTLTIAEWLIQCMSAVYVDYVHVTQTQSREPIQKSATRNPADVLADMSSI